MVKNGGSRLMSAVEMSLFLVMVLFYFFWDASMLDAACESLLSMQDNYGIDDLWIVVIQSLRQTAGQQVKEVHALLLLYKRNISSTL